jgi:2-amino-4-hydroxy-6-hydroxymethyldihydropteridine diphosphokinase
MDGNDKTGIQIAHDNHGKGKSGSFETDNDRRRSIETKFMNDKVLAYVGIGTNMGDPYKNTIGALGKLNEMDQTQLVEHSSLYWSDPVSQVSQDKFLNCVALLSTKLAPEHLLSQMQGIEYRFGRERKTRWGPRTLDLDILFYDHLTYCTENLIIPHPRVHERLFTLVPLLEITPDFQHPLLSGHLSRHLYKLRTDQTISMGYKRVPGTRTQFAGGIDL